MSRIKNMPENDSRGTAVVVPAAKPPPAPMKQESPTKEKLKSKNVFAVGELLAPVPVPPASATYAAEVALGGRVTPEPSCSCCQLCTTHAVAPGSSVPAAAAVLTPRGLNAALSPRSAAVVVPEHDASATPPPAPQTIAAPRPKNLDWECLLSAIEMELTAHNRALALSLAQNDVEEAEEEATPAKQGRRRGGSSKSVRGSRGRNSRFEDSDWESGDSSNAEDDEEVGIGSVRRASKRGKYAIAHSDSESEDDTAVASYHRAPASTASAPRQQAAGRRGPRGQSRFKGVCITRAGKWRAVIYIGRKQKYLGVFESEVAAARAYDAAAVHHFGSGAKLNFPPTSSPIAGSAADIRSRLPAVEPRSQRQHVPLAQQLPQLQQELQQQQQRLIGPAATLRLQQQQQQQQQAAGTSLQRLDSYPAMFDGPPPPSYVSWAAADPQGSVNYHGCVA